ncbi:MAG: Na/Pi cotransporter family protein [Rhizobiales bacterium]|nr:Na/Pi cotransporter family protein [Hyphomicrobiales bacterium]
MTPGTTVIIELLGGVALLLWGVRMVRTGVMRAWGDRLKRFIEGRLSNRVSAFLAGGAATAILGSGTAMTLIVAGLAASGVIGTSLGLAVLLGADVGSAVVSSVFASGSTLLVWLAPLLLFAGYCVFTATRDFRPHNVGRILIGLGLMLLALKLIVTATAPLREASLFHDVLTAVGSEQVLAFLVGAALAWICHSTLAAILLIVSFLANGSLELAGALSFILGINCGGGLPAVTATAGQPPASRRLPLANLICRGMAAVLVLAFLSRIQPLAAAIPFSPVSAAVAFHTAFNIGAGLLFLPFTSLIARLVNRMIPNGRHEFDSLAELRYLDRAALSTPGVALANASLETVRMSELLDRMLKNALAPLRNGSIETLKELKLIDDRINRYQGAVQTYLADLTQLDLQKAEARRALEIMLYASNLEHAGDIIHLNLVERIKSKTKEGIAFTLEQHASLDDLCFIIHQSLRLATGVLTTGDVEAARRLAAQKDAFRAMENRVIDEHFRESPRGRGADLRRSALFVDLIRDLHRINSHVVAAAYPIVEEAGLLRESRLRAENAA